MQIKVYQQVRGALRALLALVATFTTCAIFAQTPSSHAGMGAIVYPGGVAFRVWAPNATSVSVAGQFNGWNENANFLASEPGGHWSVDVPGAAVGQQYKYVIRHGGNTYWRMDPRGKQVTNSVGNSVIANLSFTWDTTTYSMPPWNELVLYEMHIGTFNDTPGGGPGTFTTAIGRLDHLRDLGINMIQLMPVVEFPGDFSWGYNGSQVYAPESAYGTPQQLKNFINEAHKRNMGVMLDVVHNHYGPSDLELWNFDGPSFGFGGIYFYANSTFHESGWGPRPDFGRGEVRSFIRDAVMYWLEEYRIDGLRWDSTSNIWSTNNGSGTWNPDGASLLQWINNEIKATSPWKISTAEDFHGNDWVTQPTGSGGLGFDSQWSGAFVHPMRDAMVAASDSSRNMWAVRDAIVQRYNGQGQQRVIYTESHDEVANGRSRVPEEIWPGNAGSWFSRKRSTLGATVLLTSPGIPMLFQGQEFLEDGWFQDTDPLDWSKTTTYSGIVTLYRDLIRLRRNWYNTTAGLRGNHVNVFHVNNGATHKVIAYHRWENGGVGDDVVVVVNFCNVQFPVYNLGFPRAGTWYTKFNSDSTFYGNDYGNYGTTMVGASAPGMDGLDYTGTISIAPYSALIFSQQPFPESSSVEDWQILME